MAAEFDWQAYEAELADLAPLVESVPVPALPTSPGRAEPDPAASIDGTALLEELRTALCRYLVMPSAEATDAVVLWIAATHAQPAWEHATRLGITGPAKRCGKSRLLEIIKETAYKTLPSVNASPAALYRSIDSDEPPTILYDEADTKFGSKRAAEGNEDLRALLNAGHSRGWPILRCVGPNQEVKAFASFAMAALAGIGALPDTITDRAVNIRMRRRDPTTEKVKPFRIGRDGPPLRALGERLHHWLRAHLDTLRAAEPDMPVEDRAADTWESLIAVADLAGADWPQRARRACTILTNEGAANDTDNSTSLRLLTDLRTVFTDAAKLHTTTVLNRLRAVQDGPWVDLTAHELGKHLREFGVRSKTVRETGTGPALKGYSRADLTDAFNRYLPPDVTDVSETEPDPTHGSPVRTCDVSDVTDVTLRPTQTAPTDQPTDHTASGDPPQPDTPDAAR